MESGCSAKCVDQAIIINHIKTATMEISNTIVGVLGVISIVDLLRLLIFRRKDGRQKDADAAKTELEVARETNNILKEENERLQQSNKDKDAIIEEKNKEIAGHRATESCLFDDMCIHKGCRLRKPHQGKGQLWYEQYREDPALGADYESIDTLLKRDRAKRLAENQQKSTEEE